MSYGYRLDRRDDVVRLVNEATSHRFNDPEADAAIRQLATAIEKLLADVQSVADYAASIEDDMSEHRDYEYDLADSSL